ncbi:MAG: TIGR04282 family arsenosugar biosynthesis glycosyltransferase [Ectothiorhodospiraceae bacterium]|nr:TIGR04282 family arsenosugar biosynthesis glycosyltransferase [Ectothiorhodospiraceae bacterium]MCH8503508.1 TIGR04282 family arsenosugar biosynthesis glycosyltransferase [Ectothiorhodospiraceae bacterium]
MNTGTEQQGRVLVFAKAPVPGRVKTRLAAGVGDHAAAVWFRRLTSATAANVREAWTGPAELCCAPDRAHPWLTGLARRHGMCAAVQVQGDLGRRMSLAVQRGLQSAPWVLIIGADCAPVSPRLLRQAIDALEEGTELVIGPAEDGGYVFIGCRRHVPGIFRRIPWSSGRVMRVTQQRLRRSGLGWREFHGGWDVDTLTDLRRLRRDSTGSRGWTGIRPGSALP